MAAIKLVSLNIERSKHLDTVMPFLERERPEVFCVQELHEPDIALFEKVIGPCALFAPVSRHIADMEAGEAHIMGSAIFAALPVRAKEIRYYRGSEEHARSAPAKVIMEDIPLVACTFEQDCADFRILTTHFTWSKNGEPTEQQRIDLRVLMQFLEKEQDFILCGDLNAPRGGEIFSMLEEVYKDNIPPQYKTSIDVAIHSSGAKDPVGLGTKMVDALFTTARYLASDVRLQFDISDHAAIVATVTPVQG